LCRFGEFQAAPLSVQALLPAVCILPRIKRLFCDSIVPGLELYKELADILPTNTTLKSIEVRALVNPQFASFVEALNHSKVRGLSFVGVGLDLDQFQRIRGLVLSGSINTLQFKHAIREAHLPGFYSNIMTPDVTGRLLALSLESSAGMFVHEIFNNLGAIQYLSLNSTDLEIGQILEFVANLPEDSKFRRISFSCDPTGTIDPTLDIKCGLEIVEANDVSWGTQLKPFFELISRNFKNGIQLSLAGIEKEIIKATQPWFQRSRFNRLVSLTWDDNVISPGFVRWLNRSKQLEWLSINGPRVHPDANLAGCLKGLPIKHLSVRGRPETQIGELLPKILSAVAGPRIEFLDCNLSHGGDAGMAALLAFVNASANLKDLIFDGMNVQATKVHFAEFLSNCQQQYPNLRVSWPSMECRSLLRQGLLTVDDVHQLRDKFKVTEPVFKIRY
jgi:hypothetical protein